MKVISRCLVIEDREFILFQNEQNGRIFYGTFPYGARGSLNGLQMCISFDSVEDAIEERRIQVLTDIWRARNPEHTEEDLVKYVMSIVRW